MRIDNWSRTSVIHLREEECVWTHICLPSTIKNRLVYPILLRPLPFPQSKTSTLTLLRTPLMELWLTPVANPHLSPHHSDISPPVTTLWCRRLLSLLTSPTSSLSIFPVRLLALGISVAQPMRNRSIRLGLECCLEITISDPKKHYRPLWYAPSRHLSPTFPSFHAVLILKVVFVLVPFLIMLAVHLSFSAQLLGLYPWLS